MDKELTYERYGKNEDLYRSYEERHSEGAPRTKVIMKGFYKKRAFMIGASNMGYPVAYVEVLEDDIYINKNKNDSWKAESLGTVDGSSNYYGGAYWDKNDTRKYIGWDYGHYGDFCGHNDHEDRDQGHRWTLVEILMEISEAISEIEFNSSMEYRARKYYESEQE